jgi:hypothetical protein
MFTINARHCTGAGIGSHICDPISQSGYRYEVQLIPFLIGTQACCPMTIHPPHPRHRPQKQRDLPSKRSKHPTENGGPSAHRMQNRHRREK